jgi:hypothetical protein
MLADLIKAVDEFILEIRRERGARDCSMLRMKERVEKIRGRERVSNIYADPEQQNTYGDPEPHARNVDHDPLLREATVI